MGSFGGIGFITSLMTPPVSGPPSTSTIPLDCWNVSKDATGGGIYIAANDGGIIKKVELSVTGGAPGAPVNSLQFNNAGAFGGDANLTWDAVSPALNIGDGCYLNFSSGNANSFNIHHTTSYAGDGQLAIGVGNTGGISINNTGYNTLGPWNPDEPTLVSRCSRSVAIRRQVKSDIYILPLVELMLSG
jgi:hypothetical protein